MRYHNFCIDAIYPPEFKQKLHEALVREQKNGDLDYSIIIEESAPPPEMIKDIVQVLASTLTIIKFLYDLRKATKDKGKIYLTVKGQRFDLDAYNLEEIKIKIGEPLTKRYKVELLFPNLTQKELKEWAITLSSRPVHFNGKILPPSNIVFFADYDDESGKVNATLHIDEQEVNNLYERGVPIYATAKFTKRYEGTPYAQVLFTSLILSREQEQLASKIEEC